MKITPKKFVNYIPRTPHWLVDRQGYYTMERNERVDEFSQSIMKKIFSQINSFGKQIYSLGLVLYHFDCGFFML